MMPASYCYIDMKQHPWDRGHTWAGRVDVRRVYDFEPADFLSAERLERVRGVEAAQWAELLNEPERFAEYQGYPRLCALAEVGWTQPGQRDWNDFYRRLTSGHLERLGAMGIRFRMFPPQTEYRSASLPLRRKSPASRFVIRPTERAGRVVRALYRAAAHGSSGALPVSGVRLRRVQYGRFPCRRAFPGGAGSSRTTGFQGAVERLRDPRRALAVVVHAAAGQRDDRAARSERPGYGLYDYSKRAKNQSAARSETVRRFGEPHGRPAGHAEKQQFETGRIDAEPQAFALYRAGGFP